MCMRKVAICFTIVSIGAAVFAAGPVVTVKCLRDSAVYCDGEKVEFAVSSVCEGVPTSMPVKVSVSYPGCTGRVEVAVMPTASDGTARLSYAPKLPG